MVLCPLDLKVDDLPASMPSLATIKTHAAVDGTDLDSIISDVYLPDAILWAEGQMHRTIISRGHRWVLKDFPRDARQEIRLPRGNTTAVESIVYHNNGSTTTLTGPTSSGSPAGTDWREDLRGDEGAVLMPPRGENWPNVDDDHPSPVVITFTAGWSVSAIPAPLIRALGHKVADYIGIRNTEGVPVERNRLVYAEAIVSDWSLHRWY